MGLNTSVQQFVERLNDLNRYLLYFPEENTKQLDQDEIIEILDQAKAPERHEAMVNANIDIMKYLMKNLCLNSSAWRTWRRSGAQTVPILPHYQ
jgi:antitoxin component HigA of HigAB toxin-antitoxin module